jgi:hypothetical protein
MNATIVDLRYKMKDVLEALDRNESVNVLYHGKIKGVISSAQKTERMKIKDHPFFNMNGDSTSVEETMNQLRGSRHAL